MNAKALHDDERLCEFFRTPTPEGKEIRSTIESLFVKFGWIGAPAYAEIVTPQQRYDFVQRLGPKSKVFHDEWMQRIADVKDKAHKTLEGREKANKMLWEVIESDPVKWFTGRDYRGLPKTLSEHLTIAFKATAAFVWARLVTVATKGWEPWPEGENVGHPLHLWVKDRCHTYFMGAELGEALWDTDVGGEFSLTELRWPMECFAVIFPHVIDLTHPNGDKSEAVACVMSLCKNADPVVTADCTAAEWMKWDHPRYTAPVKVGVPSTTMLTKGGVTFTVNADDLPHSIKSFLFSMLHVWVEKPELVERGHRLGHKTARKPGAVPAWSPNYIGRTYHIPERFDGPSHGDGRRVKRKVRGHFKWQAHGRQFKLRKRIFIEPYWAGSIEL